MKLFIKLRYFIVAAILHNKCNLYGKKPRRDSAVQAKVKKSRDPKDSILPISKNFLDFGYK